LVAQILPLDARLNQCAELVTLVHWLIAKSRMAISIRIAQKNARLMYVVTEYYAKHQTMCMREDYQPTLQQRS
jgi:hypothetical protein